MPMSTNSPRRFPYVRVGVTIALGAAIVVSASIARRSSHSTRPQIPTAFFKKADPDKARPGDNKRALVGVDEARWPDYTADTEAYLLRAYPESEVPGDATEAALRSWVALNASAHSNGAWQLIGPSKATYPALLDP